MAGKTAKKRVGVDIGSTAVRVVEVRGLDSKGFAVVSKVAIVPLRDQAVVAGRIRNAVQVSQALSRALKIAGVPPYGFVTGFSAPEVAVARMMLPASVKTDERIKTLRTWDKQVSPTLRLQDAALSVNEIKNVVTADGHLMSALVVAAADRDELDELRKVFRLARATPLAVDLAGAANMRALVRTLPDANEVHTVVDIGATKTSIATRQGPHLRSVRQVPIGGAAITRAIMSVSGDDREEAERRKRFLSLNRLSMAMPVAFSGGYGSIEDEPVVVEKSRETMLDEAVATSVDDLLDQIAGSIENDATNYGNTLTQGVVLCGATAQIPGMRERLNQRLGVPVQLGRPWAVLERSRANLAYFRDGQADPRLLMELTTAIGLALWREQE